jgi:threonine synthase
MAAIEIACSNCGSPYPQSGFPYCCPKCGGLYDHTNAFQYDPEKIDGTKIGMWKYRHAFGLSDEVEAVSLGEGNTPLTWGECFGRQIAFKCEYINPSGSFKDRGSSLIASWLRSRGIKEAVEDSSGNAGASFAAYAARAGIRSRIFTPASAAGPKRKQIEAYGAELVPIPGTRAAAAEAVKKEAEEGTAYASHAFLPFNLPGYATAAYEIYEQLGSLPGTVITPAGQGGLLLGLSRGFDAVRIVTKSSIIPMFIGVQARACAPLWAAFTSGKPGMATVTENDTLAEGVKVRYPLRGEAVIAAVQASNGCFQVVDEEEILPGRNALAQMGFYVEPTSAIVWAALRQIVDQLADPIVVILTGSGLKYG